MSLIFVDCEAPYGVGSPSVGDMTEFGAVEYKSKEYFHGKDCSKETFEQFDKWLSKVCGGSRPVFVSDNPGYDFGWINYYFWKYFISDFYAGLVGDFYNTQKWKRLRITKHDHNPVNDAMGNVEAFERIMRGER